MVSTVRTNVELIFDGAFGDDIPRSAWRDSTRTIKDRRFKKLLCWDAGLEKIDYLPPLIHTGLKLKTEDMFLNPVLFRVRSHII